jgi:hypothetical protein
LAADVVLVGATSHRSRVHLVLRMALLAATWPMQKTTLRTVLTKLVSVRARRGTTLLTRTTTTRLLPSLRTRATVVTAVMLSCRPVLGAIGDTAASVAERTGLNNACLTPGRGANVRTRRT